MEFLVLSKVFMNLPVPLRRARNQIEISEMSSGQLLKVAKQTRQRNVDDGNGLRKFKNIKKVF